MVLLNGELIKTIEQSAWQGGRLRIQHHPAPAQVMWAGAFHVWFGAGGSRSHACPMPAIQPWNPATGTLLPMLV